MANLKSHIMLNSTDIHTMSPNYSFMFPFEKNFEHSYTKEWMKKYWHTSFYYTSAYVVIILALKAYMSNRPAYSLKRALTLWNASLAIFSILGTMRTMPEMLHVLRNFGFYHSVCHPSFIEVTKVSGFWTWVFSLSKVPELGDTIFIVLRKRPLIFLHVYHHVTVLIFTWYTYSDYTTPARWFVDMNLFVHSIMYSYYTIMSLGIRMPKSFSMIITTCQIAQMIMGSYVIVHAYYRKLNGAPCNITQDTAIYGTVMYLSYFALFAHFFYNAYLVPKNKKVVKGKAE